MSRHLRSSVLPAYVGYAPPLEDWSATTGYDAVKFSWGTFDARVAPKVAEAYVYVVRHYGEAFTDEAFKAERAGVLAELAWVAESRAGTSDEARDAWLLSGVMEISYTDSRYGVDPAGVRDTVESVGLSELKAYAERLLNTANCRRPCDIWGSRGSVQDLAHTAGALRANQSTGAPSALRSRMAASTCVFRPPATRDRLRNLQRGLARSWSHHQPSPFVAGLGEVAASDPIY